MNKCDNCGCMVFDRTTLENGQKVCAYCENAYDAEKKAAKVQHKPREYSNLAWLIKKDNSTVKKWCQKHGLSYTIAEAVINKTGFYAETEIGKMSVAHLDVLIAAVKDGYENMLKNEEYVKED